MANDTYNIRFIADTAAIRRAQGELRRVDSNVNSIRRSADRLGQTLRRAFAVTAIAAATVALGRLADQATNIRNRIRAAGISGEEFNRTYSELLRISLETRTSFAANAQVFSRVAVGLRQYGVTSRQAATFIRSLNQAVAVGGSSATEAEAAIRQLAQGLDAGALRGDEFRSVMEQLPIVADVIARRFGVTRGELRALAEQGRLTGDEIIAAFQDAREELEERFAVLAPTIAQGFTQLRGALVDYVGGVNQASGASSNLAGALGLIATNLDAILGALGAAGVGIVGGVAARRGLAGAARLTAAITAREALAARAASLDPETFELINERALRRADQLDAAHRRARASTAALTGALGTLATVGLGAVALGLFDVVTRTASFRREIERLRLSTEDFVSSRPFRNVEIDALIRNVDPDSPDPLPGETPERAAFRRSEIARRRRLGQLRQALETQERSLEDRRAQRAELARQLGLDLDEADPDTTLSRTLDPELVRQYQEAHRLVREQEGNIRRLTVAIEVAEDPLNAYSASINTVGESADRASQALNRLRESTRQEALAYATSVRERSERFGQIAQREEFFGGLTGDPLQAAVYRELGITTARELEDARQAPEFFAAEQRVRERLEREARERALSRGSFPSPFQRFRADALEEQRLFGFSPRDRETEAVIGGIRRASIRRGEEFTPEQESEARGLIETNRRLAESYRALESATDAFTNNIGQGLHDLFTGTETSLRQVARSILSDLAQQTISRHITGPLSRSIFSGLGSAFGLGGAQLGGTYTVPGSGPADSALFAARVTPGETVTFTPPGERFGGDAGIGGGRPIVQNFNFPPQTNVQSLRRNRRAVQREALRFAGAR